MKPLSETLTELGIAFSFPIRIKDANGKDTYYEDSDSYWERWEYDAKGNLTYFERSIGYWAKYQYDVKGNDTYSETSNGYWDKSEYDAKGNRTYCEDSHGNKSGTPRSAKTCEGKVVEVDGIKYKLKAL